MENSNETNNNNNNNDNNDKINKNSNSKSESSFKNNLKSNIDSIDSHQQIIPDELNSNERLVIVGYNPQITGSNVNDLYNRKKRILKRSSDNSQENPNCSNNNHIDLFDEKKSNNFNFSGIENKNKQTNIYADSINNYNNELLDKHNPLKSDNDKLEKINCLEANQEGYVNFDLNESKYFLF